MVRTYCPARELRIPAGRLRRYRRGPVVPERLLRSLDLATVKKGILVKLGEWWKHYHGNKRSFWKRNRRAETVHVSQELRDAFGDLRRRREQEGD